MKNNFQPGDKKIFVRQVTTSDLAVFESGAVHQVYATFAIARDAEWAGRLFVLEMKEENEEGIGTYVHVNHHSPALLHQQVQFEAVLEKTDRNNVHCSFKAFAGNRLIASGTTGQKIVLREKLDAVFRSLENE
ncbi:MAG: hypothetical protein U0T73_13200 [Chitinophagales bacterium]